MPRMNRKPGEKAKDFKGTLKKLIKYAGRYRIGIIAVMICAIASATFSIVSPKILGKATTKLAEGLMSKISGTGSIDFGYIGRILIIVLVLYGISSLFNLVQGFTMSTITQKLCYRLRREIVEKINRMPMKYFESRTYGEVLSRITNDVDTLSQSLNQSATQVITSTTTIIGVLIMMLSISPLMTVVALLILPVSMGLISVIVKRSQKYFMSQQEYLGHVNGQVEEIYGGHNIIKAFNKEEDVIATFKRDNDILYTSAWKSQFLSGMMMPIMQFVGNLGYVGEVILGGYLAMKGTIQVGDIQSFIQYVRSFTMPIQQVAQVANMLQSTAAASERVFEFLEEKEEDQTVENPVCIDKLEGSVSFDHVHFGYNPDHTIINDFSVDVKPGQKVAIVGPTGAGKTTIINLLMRFYDPQSGKIRMEGKDSMEITRKSLRAAYTMVLQDTWLFYGSIYDNIAFSRQDATHEEVIEAAKAAKIHNYIMSLPDGYDTIINEDGMNISQGQKQMLTIARAMLSDAKMLILDEATSNVDTRTEIQIQTAMRNLMKDKTCFVIAHRLSTIQNADTILVVQHGDIVEQGNHEQLMRQGGIYANLYSIKSSKSEKEGRITLLSFFLFSLIVLFLYSIVVDWVLTLC